MGGIWGNVEPFCRSVEAFWGRIEVMMLLRVLEGLLGFLLDVAKGRFTESGRS